MGRKGKREVWGGAKWGFEGDKKGYYGGMNRTCGPDSVTVTGHMGMPLEKICQRVMKVITDQIANE